MSGFEILGMACAVMQVISFAHQLGTFCKDVYDGRPTVDTHCEATAASMMSASERLHVYFQSVSPQDGDQKALVDIAEKCIATAKELHTEAQKVTAYHKPGSMKKSFAAYFKFSRHKKKVMELTDALGGYRMTMETHLLARVCKQGDIIQLQQSENFINLSDSVKRFASQLADGNTNMKDLIESEASQTRDSITSSLTIRMREAISTLQTDNQRSIFLKSLDFSGMNERRCDVKPVHEATYRQLFDDAEVVGDASERSELAVFREKFVDWLRNDGNTFWIQGKPGAGKSTLVKFLVEHNNTTLELNRWSPETLIISHFFWKMGSLLQNNVKGLLYSLNHQLLSRNSVLLGDLLFELNFNAAKHSNTDWDVRELKHLLSHTLTRYQRSVCVFIDGLDEVAGKEEVEELLLTVELLRSLPNVKLCVSSRGEPIFCRHFSNAPGIKLHELTHGEMLKYATDTLSKCPTGRAYHPLFLRRISSLTVQKAEGVFLWLHLVLRTLKSGLQNGDEENELLARVEQMPSELEKLYADMWARLNEDKETYQRSAAQYFKLAIGARTLQDAYYEDHKDCTPGYGGVHVWKTTVFQVMLNKEARVREALLEKESQLLELEFVGGFLQTRSDVVTRSAGLLEVYHQQTSPKELYGRPSGIWKAMCSHVQFIHRTALDFLVNTAEGGRILAHEQSDEHDMALNFASTILCEMRMGKFLDSDDFVQDHCRYRSRMHRCRWLLSRVLHRSNHGQTRKQAEDLLQTFENLFEARLLHWDERPARCALPSFGVILVRDPTFDWFITQRCKDKGPSYATNILRDMWETMETHCHVPQPHDPHHNVQRLVSLGADLNCANVCLNEIWQFTASSAFAAIDTGFSRFLKHVVNNNTRSHVDGLRKTTGTLAAFLGAAPDLNLRTSLVIGHPMLDNNNPFRVVGLESYSTGQLSSTISTSTPLPPNFVDDGDYSVAIVLEVNLKFLVDEYIGSTTCQSGASSRYLSTAKALSGLVNIGPFAQVRFFGVLRGAFAPKELLLYRVVKTDVYENTLSCLNITRRVIIEDDIGDIHQQAWAGQQLDFKKAIYKSIIDPDVCERVDPSVLLTTLADEKLGVCRL